MSNQPWREIVWQFNLLPSLYCHESWLPPGLPAAVLETRDDPAASCHRHLAPWLLARCGMSPHLDFDFACPLRRLALMDGDTLERLAPAVGLLRLRRILRNTVDGALFAKVRKACGLDEIGFLVSAPDHVIEEGPDQFDTSLTEAVLRDLPQIGRKTLMVLATSGSVAIGNRLRLKFAHDLRLRAGSTPTRSPDASSRLGDWLAEELVPRKAPAWAWLFS